MSLPEGKPLPERTPLIVRAPAGVADPTLRVRRRRGAFITLEGPEGSGKTLQAEKLRDRLAWEGIPVVLTYEPGGTHVGGKIREMLLAHDPDAPQIRPRTDALLFNAARAQLVDEVILPALEHDVVVICARFADSTAAYQGYGQGLPVEELRAIERFATGGVTPDITVVLDVPVELGLARKAEPEQTRFEKGFDVAFHDRVRQGFLAMAQAEPTRFAVVDATAGIDEVALEVRRAISRLPGLALR